MSNQPQPPTQPKPAAPPVSRPARCVMHYTDAEGFACVLEIECESAPAAIQVQASASAHLKKIGATPTHTHAPVAAAASLTEAEPPKCKYHGGPMKQGKGGKWFCPKRINGGAYCDYTVES